MAKIAKTKKATEKPVESLEKDLARATPEVPTEDTQGTPMALSEASEVEDRLKNDFRLFLFVIWQHIGLHNLGQNL